MSHSVSEIAKRVTDAAAGLTIVTIADVCPTEYPSMAIIDAMKKLPKRKNVLAMTSVVAPSDFDKLIITARG